MGIFDFSKKKKSKQKQSDISDEKLVDIIRKSPQSIIEGIDARDKEHVYIKLPGKNIIDVTDKGNGIYSVSSNKEKVRDLLRRGGKVRYTSLHTHIGDSPFVSYPSERDISSFLRNNETKTMVIANVEEDTGKLKGYFFLKKTNKTPKFRKSGDGNDKKFSHASSVYNINMARGEPVTGLSHISKENNLTYRFVPTKGYYLDDRIGEGKFSKKRLEQIIVLSTLTLGVIILLSLTDFDQVVVGNVIGANLRGSVFPGILIIVGLMIAVYFYSKRK